MLQLCCEAPKRAVAYAMRGRCGPHAVEIVLVVGRTCAGKWIA